MEDTKENEQSSPKAASLKAPSPSQPFKHQIPFLVLLRSRPDTVRLGFDQEGQRIVGYK